MWREVDLLDDVMVKSWIGLKSSKTCSKRSATSSSCINSYLSINNNINNNNDLRGVCTSTYICTYIKDKHTKGTPDINK